MTITKRLAMLREKSGLSQQEISKRLGIARTTYASYEQGAREPDISMLNKLSSFHGVSVEWLINGRDREMNPEIEKMIEDILELNDKDQQYIYDLVERLKKERP